MIVFTKDKKGFAKEVLQDRTQVGPTLVPSWRANGRGILRIRKISTLD
jgi:hypothetical protein